METTNNDKIFDTEALYLYRVYGCRYRLGKIEKVNEKSIRMDYETLIPKKNFEKEVYQLTDTEMAKFFDLAVKNIKTSTICSLLDKMTDRINTLDKVLKTVPYIKEIDTDLIEKDLEEVREELNKLKNDCIDLNNTTFEVRFKGDYYSFNATFTEKK